MMPSNKIIILGTSYHSGAIILLECNDDALPKFGQVDEIFIYNDLKLIVYSILNTLWFERKLNAYRVIKSATDNEKKIIEVKDLIFPYPLSTFNTMNNTYVPLINHERTEFEIL